MKVLVINGSPRGTKSNTDRILLPFLEGAREAGADTEIIYLKDKMINYCLGCFSCWTKTPGVCVHKDDMPPLLEKVRHSDILLYASPLYIYSVTAQMKTFMDRCLPLTDPHVIKRGDQYIHPKRYEGPPKKVILLSNCGFPERHHFQGLIETFRRYTSGPDTILTAMILCAGGELLAQAALQEQLQWYVEAARRAGKEVIELGRITPETQATLDCPLAEADFYSQMANAYWESVLPHEQTPGETLNDNEAGTPLPAPVSNDTLRDIVAGMALAFDPRAAQGLNSIVQFDVSGAEPGNYYLRIAEGKCTAFEGVHPAPSLTIHTPSEIWLAISRGELSGVEGYIKKMYRVEGDMGLLMRFDQLFSTMNDPEAEQPAPVSTPSVLTPQETVQRGPLKLGMNWLVVAFVPWIAHWVMNDIRGLNAWITVGVPFLLGVLVWGYRRAFRQETWMDIGTPIYFGVLALLVLFGIDFVREYSDVVGQLAMSGIWLATLASAAPLTYHYSKWSYPAALWTDTVFIRTNTILTAFWGLVFLVMAVAALAGHAAENHLLWVIIRNMLMIPAFAFTFWFQRWYPIRMSYRK